MAGPTTLLLIAAFLLGTIVGSFLNVLIYRAGSGKGILGRSQCLSCGKALRPMMLIPLFSYLVQRGRCAYCGAKLSSQYPLIEAATGALFVIIVRVNAIDPWTADMMQLLTLCLDATLWSTLLVIVVYDLKHKIILDRLSLVLAFLALLSLLFRWQSGLLVPMFLPLLGVYLSPVFDLFAGPLLALPFALLWYFSGGRAMGLGDAKLSWGLGWYLGFSGGISAVILGFWTAFVPSLLLLLLPRKRFTMKSEIPFAPFLVFGALIVYVWGIDILQWTF